MNTGILKEIRHVNCLGLTLDTDHVLSKLYHSGSAGIRYLSCRHAAAEVKIRSSIVIHQHRRVKEPQYIGTVRCLSGNQRFAEGVSEGSCGTVCLQHTDSAAVIRKVKEKSGFAVYLLPGSRRCPGIVCPCGSSVFSRHDDTAVIRKIHHVIRGYHIEATDFTVGILNYFSLVVVLKSIRSHIKINSVFVDHRIRVCSESLCHNRIGIREFLISCCITHTIKARSQIFCRHTGTVCFPGTVWFSGTVWFPGTALHAVYLRSILIFRCLSSSAGAKHGTCQCHHRQDMQ